MGLPETQTCCCNRRNPDYRRHVFPPLSPVNEPPTFHRPQSELQTFAGENFVFQFAASDPEGSALLFQLDEGPKGALLSPAGLLVWKVPEEEEGHRGRHPVRVTLLDECNAQSGFTVEVTEPMRTGAHTRSSFDQWDRNPAGFGAPMGWIRHRKNVT